MPNGPYIIYYTIESTRFKQKWSWVQVCNNCNDEKIMPLCIMMKISKTLNNRQLKNTIHCLLNFSYSIMFAKCYSIFILRRLLDSCYQGIDHISIHSISKSKKVMNREYANYLLNLYKCFNSPDHKMLA